MLPIGTVLAVVFGALPFCGNSSANALERAGIPGIWITDRNDGEVEIKPCGDRLCGYVYSINYPNPIHPGEPLPDGYNENPKLRSRLLCGIQVMGDLRKQPDGSWTDGWGYDPKMGKTYSIELRLQEPNVLAIFGYLGVKLLGKTVLYTRSKGEWKQCSTKRQ